MAMEERQTQIKEGAGLEESRLNVEFIDWLRKWSTPLIVILAVIAAGFFLYKRVQQARIAHEARAFAEYTLASASRNPSPEALKSIAQEYDDVGAIGSLARLLAADTYLRSVRLGLRLAVNTDPGPDSDLNPDGTPKDPEDLLRPEDRERYLAEAEALYRHVYQTSHGSPAKVLVRVDASFGLAAIAESRGDLDLARRIYNEIESEARAAGLVTQAKLAAARAETLHEIAEPPVLYARADLPPEPVNPMFTLPEMIEIPAPPEEQGEIGPPVEFPPIEIPTPPTGEPAQDPPGGQ